MHLAEITSLFGESWSHLCFPFPSSLCCQTLQASLRWSTLANKSANTFQNSSSLFTTCRLKTEKKDFLLLFYQVLVCIGSWFFQTRRSRLRCLQLVSAVCGSGGLGKWSRFDPLGLHHTDQQSKTIRWEQLRGEKSSRFSVRDPSGACSAVTVLGVTNVK